MSTKNNKTMLLSSQFKAFCDLLEQIPKDYDWNMEEMRRFETMTQDYLHALELGGLKYKERARVATQLSLCRQRRRAHKDAAQVIEPVVAYLESAKGKNILNELRGVLGEIRKEEKHLENRTYVLKEGEAKEVLGRSTIK